MRYSVLGPERLEIEYIDYWIANKIPWHDWYLVDAPNKKAAGWAAWKRAKENKDLWYTGNDYSEHPLRGIKVEVFPEPGWDTPTFDRDTCEWYYPAREWDPMGDGEGIAGKEYYINVMS